MAESRTKSEVLRSRVRRNGLPMFGVVLIVAVGWFVVRALIPSPRAAMSADTDETTLSQPASLVLPEAKVDKARLRITASAVRRIEDVRTVSGRLTYDESRHIEVKAPVSGMLVDVVVKPGDAVEEGDLLAVIGSPEIGQARAAVLSARAKRQVILQQVARLENVAENLRALFVMLDGNAALDDVEREFNSKFLGDYREEILAAYSTRILTRQLANSVRPLGDSGSVPLRTLRERENARHVADAKFRAARETTEFDISIRRQQILVQKNDADRDVLIAENHLRTLLGIADGADAEIDTTALSRLEVRAPFQGTVESRTFARRERVQSGDAMFVLANTESLYVSADIRENEWAVLQVQPGQELTVIVPAIPDRTFTATVHYIGREVVVESNSLPLVATISNAEDLLRPGMFVRVAIPVSETGDVVAVPAESVMQHEDEQFVFVSLDRHTFRRVDVQTGVHDDDWVEIRRGLQAGDPVVADGAFLLKSELLLSGEGE